MENYLCLCQKEIFVHKWCTCRLPAALVGMQQHPLDDVGVDVVRLHVFDGTHRVIAGLDRNALVDDRMAGGVAAFPAWFDHGVRRPPLVWRPMHREIHHVSSSESARVVGPPAKPAITATSIGQ